MLSYRHGFHAGNHADVLKHFVLLSVIDKLKQKNKPFVYLDTHSGRGLYDLSAAEALKNAEYSTGIEKVLVDAHNAPESLLKYADFCQLYFHKDIKSYPGSPEIARANLREQDKLILMELHNQEVLNLKSLFSSENRTSIHHRDGFEGLNAVVPPKPARGVVLVDPAYEVKQDYQAVVDSVAKAYKKWPTGIYLIWYPILARGRDQSESLYASLSKAGFNSLLLAELTICQQASDFGMHGSGMAIVNAPFKLDQQIQQALPYLQQLLAQDKSAYSRCEWLIEPA
ncbi:23S rRNA (adenine(2030)-N(6))-methyltransferase RlmJ [Catenovulum sediminis]|uniref:Ribosomal RNA large subunit methyltransferase J n=1 Tax=Catenovulum sediminis TaxID=1740262 RepID=A0ABV1RI50_9ALTE|nr:23S rRNA (adenine(2030)-N(6))-methyltransferase RlmJ [Catenovulum sediminis]